jgi:hypothetical protein
LIENPQEFGIVRSEMDLIYDERRQKKLQPVMQSFSRDTDPAERKVKINNTEQALNIRITISSKDNF